MKFLENSKLEAVADALTNDSGELKLDVRLESYSCKLVNSDKRSLTAALAAPGTSPHDLQPLSPPILDSTLAPLFPSSLPKTRRVSGGSDTGDDATLCDSINRKMLFNLTALLNASFPDYDFSAAKGDHFSACPDIDTVRRLLDTHLGPSSQVYYQLKPTLWALIDEEIKLRDCLIYSYNPDLSVDPFSEDGCLWSFNFFFYNRGLKRILFLACRAINAVLDDSDEAMWALDEE